jgi:S1-C subfamily serine protease
MTKMKTGIIATALAAAWIGHSAGMDGLGDLQPAPQIAGIRAESTSPANQRAADKKAPTSEARELLALQERIQASIRTTLPSIVSLWSGSGVIVSPDGLILTQAHLVGGRECKAGNKIWLAFQDDRTAQAEIVGADHLHDLALLRLVKPGPYPFTPLAEHNPSPGTAVLKFGYPGPLGYQKGWPAPPRFGTVLAIKPDRFVADCAINGGDSGGPYIDLENRVVGIVNAGYPIRDERIQSIFPHNLFDTHGRNWYAATSCALLREQLPRMARGEFITPTDEESASYSPLDVKQKDPILYPDLIPEDRRTHGKDMLARFRNAVADIRGSVVEILDGSQTTALGTVVDAAGLVLTKASEVPDNARCRLPGGQVVPIEVVGVNPAYDLALLQVSVQRLVPVTWAPSVNLPAGTLLAAAGKGELPHEVGIVSVPRRDTPGRYPSAPHRYQRPELPASPPELTGSSAPGGGFVVETMEGNAAVAGIRRGDVILEIAGKPVPDNSYLKKLPKPGGGWGIPIVGMNRYDQSYYAFRDILPLAGGDKKPLRAGDRVPVRLLRGEQEIELSLELPTPSEKEHGFWFDMVPSKHADIPPTVIISDIPVYHQECGGPAVDINGNVIGLIISRFGVVGSYLIPADHIIARLAELKLGKPLPGFSSTSKNVATDADSK